MGTATVDILYRQQAWREYRSVEFYHARLTRATQTAPEQILWVGNPPNGEYHIICSSHKWSCSTMWGLHLISNENFVSTIQLNCLFINEQSKKLTTENFTKNPQGLDIESPTLTKEGEIGHDDEDAASITDEMIQLKIPNEENERTCPNCCAICLDPYKVDDVIVWSSSQDCRHVFHQECLVEGLSRARSSEAPCPCCRIIFCEIQMEPRQWHPIFC